MTGVALARPIPSMMWELRGAWASGRRIAISLDAACDPRRVEGFVQAVSPTDGWVRVQGWRVPSWAVLAVHRPSRLGDSTARGGPWHGMARCVVPQTEALW